MAEHIKQLESRFPSKVSILVACVCIAVLFAMIFPAILQVRQAAREDLVENNLRQVALALHNYESPHGHLPAANHRFTPGGAEHSWMTSILPFMESSHLFESIDQSRDWDDHYNRPLLTWKIQGFFSPHLTIEQNERGFALSHIAANEEVLEYDKNNKLTELEFNQVLVGEICSNFQPWGKPGNTRSFSDSILFDDNTFGSPASNNTIFAMADGSSRVITADSDIHRPKPIQPRAWIDLKTDFRWQELKGHSFDTYVFGEQCSHSVRFRGQNKANRDDFPVTDECLLKLCGLNETVTNVVIGFNNTITDDGVVHLAKMKQLDCLSLEGFEASDKGLESLADLKNLKVLILASGKFTDEGLEKLKLALPNCDIDVRTTTDPS